MTPQNHQQFFEYLRYGKNWDDEKRKARYDNIVVAGYDSEYEREEGNHNKNYVISYQTSSITEMAGGDAIRYTRNGERLKLADIAEMSIKAAYDGRIPSHFKRARNLLVLVAHFSVADWSTLADRDQPYIRRQLKKIRKSPVTGNRTIKVTIGRSCTVRVMLYDTMLTAPAGYQSLDALSTLTSAHTGMSKIPVSDYYKSHMREYLRDHPEDFERYAIQDAVVTRDSFIALQENLNQLAFGSFRKLFLTLAAAGVAGFRENNSWYKEYTKSLTKAYPEAYALVREGFLGGRNESFFFGNTDDYPETVNKIWPDVDFRNYYPSCLVTVPKIDEHGQADLISLRYACTDTTVAKLADARVPVDIINDIRIALHESPDAFDRVLRKGRRYARVAQRVREICTVVDRRLLDKWRKDYADAVASGDPERLYCIPGFALVRVRYSAQTLYPGIPTKHEDYGLGYFLESTSVITAIEAVLAVEAGAVVEPLASVELPIKRDEYGKPVFLYRSYLTHLIQERGRYKKDQIDPSAKLKEQLLKELANSFFGKLGQGIGNRTGYDPASGGSMPVLPSSLTEACAAGLATGLGRAALSSVLHGVELYNRGKSDPSNEITAISCTTDGLLLGLRMPPGYSVLDDYYKPDEKTGNLEFIGVKWDELLARCNCNQLMPLINRYTPIKLLRAARIAITGSDELFEVKHLVDSVHSIKNRGQIGYIANGDVHVMARFGHRIATEELDLDPGEPEPKGMRRKILEARWFTKHIQMAELPDAVIPTYLTNRLAGLRPILESEGQLDCVMLYFRRNVNVDFDYKRRVVSRNSDPVLSESSISPSTVPHRSVDQMLIYRRAMEEVRASGKPATARRVISQVTFRTRPIRFTGGDDTTVIRQFLRGVRQGFIPVAEELPEQLVLADRINDMLKHLGCQTKDWTVNDIKKAKEGKWCPGCIPATGNTKKLVERLCALIGADPLIAQDLLLATGVFESISSTVLDQVIKALRHGPRLGIKPLLEVQTRALIPSHQRLLAIFPQITDQELAQCDAQDFQPGALPRYCHGQVVRVFRLLRIPRSLADACASVIAPPPPRETRTYKEMIQQKCLRSFVQALFQPDITACEFKSSVVFQKLQKFGLTRRQIYSYRSTKFIANTIKDVPGNRSLIRRLAKAVDRDVSPYLAALLAK